MTNKRDEWLHKTSIVNKMFTNITECSWAFGVHNLRLKISFLRNINFNRYECDLLFVLWFVNIYFIIFFVYKAVIKKYLWKIQEKSFTMVITKRKEHNI